MYFFREAKRSLTPPSGPRHRQGPRADREVRGEPRVRPAPSAVRQTRQTPGGRGLQVLRGNRGSTRKPPHEDGLVPFVRHTLFRTVIVPCGTTFSFFLSRRTVSSSTQIGNWRRTTTREGCSVSRPRGHSQTTVSRLSPDIACLETNRDPHYIVTCRDNACVPNVP